MVLIRNELIQSLRRPRSPWAGARDRGERGDVARAGGAAADPCDHQRPLRLGRGELGKPLDLAGRGVPRCRRRLRPGLGAAAVGRSATGPSARSWPTSPAVSPRSAASTAGVAHEVKNPLNAMTIHLELLKQKLASPDPGAAGSACGGHRLGNPPPRRCGPGVPEVRQARGRDAWAGEDGDARRERPRGGRARGGAQRRQLREQLPGSAAGHRRRRDAAPAGVPEPGAERHSGDAPRGQAPDHLLRRGKDGRIEVRVQDTGDGIPPEHLARIFDLYFTTKKRGSGIGLSLVFRTIQLHNGDIDVESTVGTGTTFVIKLPRARSGSIMQCDCSPLPSWWHWPWAVRRAPHGPRSRCPSRNCRCWILRRLRPVSSPSTSSPRNWLPSRRPSPPSRPRRRSAAQARRAGATTRPARHRRPAAAAAVDAAGVDAHAGARRRGQDRGLDSRAPRAGDARPDPGERGRAVADGRRSTRRRGASSQQSEDALKVRNLLYAGKLADKAAAMAAVLVR